MTKYETNLTTESTPGTNSDHDEREVTFYKLLQNAYFLAKHDNHELAAEAASLASRYWERTETETEAETGGE